MLLHLRGVDSEGPLRQLTCPTSECRGTSSTVMMSDSEPNPTTPDPVAAAETRDPDDTDSLSIFPSESTESEGTYLLLPDPADPAARARTSPGPTQSSPGWPSEAAAGIRNARYRSGYSVPVSIADDRATREAIWKLGAYVETVATLQEVCTSIDTRLIRAEEALARTEGFVADRTLHELSTRIAARLTDTEDAVRHIEEALARTEGIVADRTLHELSTRIAARLTETEDAVRHIERVVTSGPPEELVALQAVCTSIDARLVQAEETLARTEGLVADRALHELSTRIATRLAETEDTVRHIERVVTSGPPEELVALQTLCAKIEKRLAHVEESLGRTEGLVTDRSFNEMSAHISARLTGTEDAVRRIEGLVASGALAELSARVDFAFAQSDDALRRIEAAVERKSAAPSIDRSAVDREAAVALVPSRPSQPPALSTPSLVRGLPGAERLVGLGAATFVLVGVLIFVAPARVPIRVAAPPPPRAAVQQPAAPIAEREPQEQAPPEQPAPPTRLSPPPPAAEASAPAPRRRTPARTTDDATAPPVAPARFVGDLSITSTPLGARVFVNGRAVGVTPLVLREQRAGSVAVQIASEGFERWSASVQIPAGQVTSVEATLRASRPQ